MDPNRNNLSFVLKLPTARLLRYYKKQRNFYADYEDSWIPYADGTTCKERMDAMRRELSLRENIS